jgi:regulator of cell morphogenesis and NO signaling
MNAINSLSLAQIVKTNHKAGNVFEKYHLDFCCKGKRSLEQACAEQQLPLADVMTELQDVFASNDKPVGPDFENMKLSELMGHIVSTHHSYVKTEMPQIYTWLQKVASKHGERNPELYKIYEMFCAVKEEMEMHMKKEEMILFPRLNELQKIAESDNSSLQVNITYLQGPITVMEQEHDYAGNKMNEIRLLSSDYTPPADACTTYQLSFAALKAFEIDLHQHVHLENNILFPKALGVFNSLRSGSLN